MIKFVKCVNKAYMRLPLAGQVCEHVCCETHACVKSECLSHETHVLRLSPSCEHVCHVTFMGPL